MGNRSYTEDPTTWNPWTRACMLKGPDELRAILEGQCPTCLRNLDGGHCGVCEIQWSGSVSDDGRSRFTACREINGKAIDLMEWVTTPSMLLEMAFKESKKNGSQD